MFSKIKQILWGDLSGEEFRFYGLLSVIFFFIIGAYWTLRLLKNTFFMHIVGPQAIPYAKMVSIISLVALVMFYSKLVDWFERTTLVYVVVGGYIAIFGALLFFLQHETIGIANTVPHPMRMLGWVLYVVTESFGSIVIALFWSYVASVVDERSAKRGYPVVVAGAQLGSILGSAMLISAASPEGVLVRFGIAAAGLLVVPVLVYFFSTRIAPKHGVQAREEKKKATGVFEGLRLLASHTYLLGILVVSTVYEIIVTFFDFLMNVAAKEQLGAIEKVASFQGMYGVATNSISFLFALIGTSFFIRRFGLKWCLTLYPIVIAILVLMVWGFPGLWIFFAAEVTLKGLGYALNNPCKEIMYLPTSKDVKFKVKSWIDVQGSRGAKGLGALMNASFAAGGQLIACGSLISLAVIAAWIPIAWFVGRKHSELVKHNQVIE